MATYKFALNGAAAEVDVDPSTPLLWVLRDHLGLTGTKFGCGAALCGACTVHVNGEAARSCVLPVDALAPGAQVTTIEGLGKDRLHPIQQAWIALQVPQCGYCQPGVIMAAAALLAAKPKPTSADIEASITNICRCGTYARIKQAILTLHQ
jgi:isoquinoline 1-oxidoreductase alpha subunit